MGEIEAREDAWQRLNPQHPGAAIARSRRTWPCDWSPQDGAARNRGYGVRPATIWRKRAGGCLQLHRLDVAIPAWLSASCSHPVGALG